MIVGGSGDYGCVDNNEPWFSYFCGVLRNIVASKKPLFCSCFGHQALATALGGKVSTDRERSELGTFEVSVNEEGRRDELFGNLYPSFKAQFGHNDFVSELPVGAVNLASTPLCAVQAYRLEGRLCYATQFHPELSHLENQERAMNYLAIYSRNRMDPKELDIVSQPSIKASELLPRFMEMVAAQTFCTEK